MAVGNKAKLFSRLFSWIHCANNIILASQSYHLLSYFYGKNEFQVLADRTQNILKCKALWISCLKSSNVFHHSQARGKIFHIVYKAHELAPAGPLIANCTPTAVLIITGIYHVSASSGIFVYLVSFAKNIFIPYFCFLKDSFIFMYTYECLRACMSVHYLHACCFLEPEESNRSPGAGSCHVQYIIVTEPGSSSRAASALNYLAISPASEFSFLIFFCYLSFLPTLQNSVRISLTWTALENFKIAHMFIASEDIALI